MGLAAAVTLVAVAAITRAWLPDRAGALSWLFQIIAERGERVSSAIRHQLTVRAMGLGFS